MTGDVSSGHFVGFYLAIVGLVVITVVSSRPAIARKLGSRRLPAVACAVMAMMLLAVFGSGTRTISFRAAVGPSAGLTSQATDVHVAVALADVTRPEFVQYVAVLDGPPVTHPERFATALSVRVVTAVDVMDERLDVSPPPKVGQTWLMVTYRDEDNAVLSAFDGGAGARRFVVAKRLVMDVLPHVVTVAALRIAPTDHAKQAILQENPFVTPIAAEWIARELGTLERDASPAVARALEQKRAYVQKYVEQPQARGLRAGLRIDAP